MPPLAPAKATASVPRQAGRRSAPGPRRGQGVHGEQPQKAHALQHYREHCHRTEQRRRIAQAPLGRRREQARQLHAEDDEDDAVEHELQGLPHASGLKLRARGGHGVALRQKRHDEPRGHHGDDRSDMQRFRRQIDDEGQEQLQHHVKRGGIEPGAADELQKPPGEHAHDQAAGEPAEQIKREFLARMHKRERAGGQKRHAALEDHRAGHIVEQGLALEQRLVAAPEAAVVGERRHRHGIGGAHGRAERAGCRKRNRRHQGVQRRPAGDDDGEDEPHRQRRDTPAVLPQRPGIHMARLVEVQRCDEQDEQKLRIDPPLQRRGHSRRDNGAQGHLNERQRHPRQELVQDAGGDDRRQQKQNQLEGLQRVPAPYATEKFRNTLANKLGSRRGASASAPCRSGAGHLRKGRGNPVGAGPRRRRWPPRSKR